MNGEVVAVPKGLSLLATMGLTAQVNRFAWSRDGDLVGCACEDGTVRIYNRSGQLMREIACGHGPILDIAWSNDGEAIAGGCADGAVRVYEALSGCMASELRGHTLPVLSVTFGVSPSVLISASADGSIRVWDVTSGSVIQSPIGHGAAVHQVALSPDLEYLELVPFGCIFTQDWYSE
jgi:WD40 repeat protein